MVYLDEMLEVMATIDPEKPGEAWIVDNRRRMNLESQIGGNPYAHMVVFSDWVKSFDHQMFFDLWLKKVSPEKAREVVKVMADLAHIETVMDSVRKPWHVQIGAGSQDWALEDHIQFHEMVLEVTHEMKRQDEDEDGD